MWRTKEDSFSILFVVGCKFVNCGSSACLIKLQLTVHLIILISKLLGKAFGNRDNQLIQRPLVIPKLLFFKPINEPMRHKYLYFFNVFTLFHERNKSLKFALWYEDRREEKTCLCKIDREKSMDTTTRTLIRVRVVKCKNQIRFQFHLI